MECRISLDISGISDIEKLKDINGISISELDRRMKPLRKDPETGSLQYDKVVLF